MHSVCFACGIQYGNPPPKKYKKTEDNETEHKSALVSRLIINQLLCDTLQVPIFLFLIWHCVALTWWFLIIVVEIWINADVSSSLKHNTLGACFLWIDDLTRCTCVARLARHVPFLALREVQHGLNCLHPMHLFSHLYSPVLYKIKTFKCLNHYLFSLYKSSFAVLQFSPWTPRQRNGQIKDTFLLNHAYH